MIPSIPSASVFGFKNKLIGGDFMTNPYQRGAITSAMNANNFAGGADRWRAYRGGFATGGECNRVGLQPNELGPNTGAQRCLRVQRIAGNTSTAGLILGTEFDQVNNGVDVRWCLGRRITLSFYIRCGSNFSAASNAFVSNIVTGTGSDQSLASGFTGAVTYAKTHTINTSFQRLSHTVTIPADINIIQLGVYFYFTPTGTAGVNDFFDIALVQLEEGGLATPFEFRPPEYELYLCKRYFQKISTGTMFRFTSAGSVETGYVFPVEMRKAPTVTYPETINGNNVGIGGVSSASPGGVGPFGVTPSGIGALYIQNIVGGSPTVGQQFSITSGSIHCSAEVGV